MLNCQDRTKEGVTKSQPGFFSIVVMPQVRMTVPHECNMGKGLFDDPLNHMVGLDALAHAV